MYKVIYISGIVLLLSLNQTFAGKISAAHLPSDEEILLALDEQIQPLQQILQLRDTGNMSGALSELITYLKDKAGKRYYFDWQNFESRFSKYKNDYPQEKKKHFNLANYQMTTYGAETGWILPSVDLKGRNVTAYELRHLSRQQKSADMTLTYFYKNREHQYLDYFVRQVADLNRAFTSGAVDEGGNAVYEPYRAGKRIHNWLFNYNAYLSSNDFKPEHHLLLIRTFLHHGAQLNMRTKKFSYGNHQTKGLVALFEITALLPEFECTKQWQKHAVEGLTWHITNEINPDGFQFERSVHYHMGDVENYFRVYQLARINNIDLPDIFISQFRKMFESLVKLAQPNRKLPVLQDDTDDPYAENNDVRGTMTIGTLLFQDPQFRYFADDLVPPDIYWLLDDEQLNFLNAVKPVKPAPGSTELTATGYYTMRGGWEKNDLYMTITAGLSEEKPDHQHGDMLGVVAYANGHEILPNYQVRYKHPEYRHFKNSWVKNVAVADSIPQGIEWKQNSGKSGFGKWVGLPKPQVLSWITNETYDYFYGSHDGYKKLNINYLREVLFIKNKFWIIRDHFAASDTHIYQQVWQGKYENDSENEVVKQYEDGSGLLIRQLAGKKFALEQGAGVREKFNLVFNTQTDTGFVFSTLLLPFKNGKRNLPEPWQINDPAVFNISCDAELSLSSKSSLFLFGLRELRFRETRWQFETPVTVQIERVGTDSIMRLLSKREINVTEYKINQVSEKIISSETTYKL